MTRHNMPSYKQSLHYMFEASNAELQNKFLGVPCHVTSDNKPHTYSTVCCHFIRHGDSLYKTGAQNEPAPAGIR